MKPNLKFSLIVTFIFVFTIAAYPVTTRVMFEDRPMKITKKPKVRADGCGQQSGTVTARATFEKTGSVTNVVILSPSGCDIFDERVVKAMYAIEFEPAIKDDEPITVTKQLQYTFRKFY